jgi:branched-chain amino acid aminotransferase
MLDWAHKGEAALSGTAAVLAGVGTLIYAGAEHKVGGGDVGPLTRALRAQLVAVQQGEAPDRHGWLERV